MFVDEISLEIRAGRGGDGCIAFLREKFRPKGGPAGGDGGKGGSVIFEARSDVDTLVGLMHRRVIAAPGGRPGMGKNKSGKKGDDVIVQVPVGTIIRNAATGDLLMDMCDEGATCELARGGRGGKGNQHYATSTRQAPRIAQDGKDGEEIAIDLELKLIADVGLVGAPNAGKSTLVRRISAAKPKVADYPFTTLEPCLGIVDSGDYRQLVVADIPGLIEGAHAGVGLGDDFLRHIERTAFLLELVDLVPIDGSNPAETVLMLRKELEQYSEELARRPRVVVGSKLDMPGSAEALEALRDELGEEVIGISSLTGEGLKPLVGRLFQELRGPEDGRR